MKRVVHIALCLCVLTSLCLAANSGDNATKMLSVRAAVISNLNEIIERSEGGVPPGIWQAVFNQIDKIGPEIQSLYAVDTTAMSAEELTAYAKAIDDGDTALQAQLNDQKKAIQDGDTALQAQLNETGTSIDSGDTALQGQLNNLTSYVQFQSARDPNFGQTITVVAPGKFPF
jgi:hypothetical protein